MTSFIELIGQTLCDLTKKKRDYVESKTFIILFFFQLVKVYILSEIAPFKQAECVQIFSTTE